MTITNRYILLSILLPLIGINTSSAQEPEKAVKKEPKIHVILDYHYNFGLATREKWWNDGEQPGGHSLHLTALYDIIPRIAAGIGIGADRYTHPGFNTIPIYGTFRYSPVPCIPKGYVYTNLGYGCFANDAIAPGWMWDLGIGYTKMFRRHFGLNFQIGYNLKEFAGIPSYRYDIDTENITITYLGKIKDLRHSLSIGIGLVF